MNNLTFTALYFCSIIQRYNFSKFFQTKIHKINILYEFGAQDQDEGFAIFSHMPFYHFYGLNFQLVS